jgi:hypothetical protein
MEHTPVDRVAQLEDQVSRLTSLVEGLQAERMAGPASASENGSRSPRSRRDLLKLAGAAAAGAAGVALAGRSVKDAYAVTTDTNFVANGTTNIGFSTIPGTFATGVYTTGSNLGIYSTGVNAGGQFSNGARGNFVLLPSASAGPNGGNHYTGDFTVDSNGVIFVCTSGNGTAAGTNVPLQQGGIDNAIFTTVSSKQYLLGGSNGVTWVDMDAVNLSLTIVSPNNARAIMFANADLWTDTANLNQDLAITVNGTVHSWKESGGPGTFSPNAAFVHAVYGDFFAGTSYTVKLQWKANKAATSAQHIVAGAGPIPAGSTTFSPTRLSVQLINI